MGQDRSRPLPRPPTIPTVMDLVTLADARELIRHVPKERRDDPNWRRLAVSAAVRRHPISLSAWIALGKISAKSVHARSKRLSRNAISQHRRNMPHDPLRHLPPNFI
jgi:hypothetical protein